MKRLSLLASTLALVACSSSGTTPPPGDAGPIEASPGDSGAPQWTPVVQGLSGALLSIWGTNDRDIWTVGGPLGNGGEALVMHFDGAMWKRLSPIGSDSYWWVHGTAADDVWFVGEKGHITHWDGTKLDEHASGTTATLFGVWAAARDDVWAVGGVPDSADAPNDVVLHYDGTSWKPEALPETKKTALFKVWGSSADDVYVVGEAGVIWHRKRTSSAPTWTREGEGVARNRLTTVTGCSANELYAVGGRDVLTSKGDGTWTRVPTDDFLLSDVNGVACAPAGAPARDYGRVVIVGGGSVKLRLVGSTWKDGFGTPPLLDLHGAWVDPTGAFWGAGGRFNDSPRSGASRTGVVARLGEGTVPIAVAP